jgi:hypothetical protein
MKTIGDQQLLKRMNRSVLLRLLRAQPGLSRARLASESGLTKSTVSLLVRELLDEGWLSESGAAVADGLGRPSTPLQINVGVRALMGIEIAVDTARLACVSLQGEVLHSDEQALADSAPAGTCAQVARMAAAAHRRLAERGLRLSSIGVCVPGAVDDCTGEVRFAPNLGWRNVRLLPMLEDALAAAGLTGVTVQLQNDADAAALGEYEFAAGEGEDPLIFVNCDVGVGAGVVLNDRLFTGAQGMAGEIGHTILELDGPPCSCGRRGCAEAFFELIDLPVELIHLTGSVELGPLTGMSEAIVDLVASGRTLRDNGLVAIEDLFESTARLIGHPLAMRLDQGQIQAIVARIAAVARGAAPSRGPAASASPEGMAVASF